MQEEGVRNEGRHHLLLLHKQAHDKRHCGITVSVHKEATCVVGKRNITNLENTPTPLYEEPGVIHGHITIKACMALGDNYSKKGVKHIWRLVINYSKAHS